MKTKLCSGMTLVELLIAISIMGLLIALTAVGLNAARKTVNDRAVIAEINGLSAALTEYKNQHNSYPPCMNAVTSTPAVAAGQPMLYYSRKFTFYLHLRQWGELAMFAPSRYSRNGQNSQIYNAEHIGDPTAIANYNNWNADIIGQYRYQTASGGVAKLNFDTLDAAEALVFWLGGMPTPFNMSGVAPGYIAASKLCGFSTNPQDPFRLAVNPSSVVLTGEAFMAQRTKPLFDFDETRLVDYDGDGWLEYVPRKPDPNDPNNPLNDNNPPPYVYFDAELYTKWFAPNKFRPFSTYPAPQGTIPGIAANNAMIQAWGTAMPYAITKTPTAGSIIPWINGGTAPSFQIIAAGADNKYSSYTGTASATLLGALPRLVSHDGSLVQNGYVILTPDSASPYPAAEDDNLTNFASSRLGDYATQLDEQ